MDAIIIAAASLAGVVLLAAVGIATLIVHVGRGIRRDLGERIDAEGTARRSDVQSLTARIDQAEEARRSDVRDLAAQIGELRDRMSRVEGLLEGLRDAITGRRAA